MCMQIAKQYGILLDPIYSLAAWEVALELAESRYYRQSESGGNSQVVMLHTGGASGLHGLAQRFPDSF